MRSGRSKGGEGNHPALVELGRGDISFSVAEFQCLVTSFVRLLCELLNSTVPWQPPDPPHLPDQAAAKISGQFSGIAPGVTPAGPILSSELQFYKDKCPIVKSLLKRARMVSGSRN